MDTKRMQELAGLTEAKKAFAVFVKHKGQPEVAITPRGGVTKERANEVKTLLMSLKKDGMKGGKSSDDAVISVRPVGTLKEASVPNFGSASIHIVFSDKEGFKVLQEKGGDVIAYKEPEDCDGSEWDKLHKFFESINLTKVK